MAASRPVLRHCGDSGRLPIVAQFSAQRAFAFIHCMFDVLLAQQWVDSGRTLQMPIFPFHYCCLRRYVRFDSQFSRVD
jgi:hypothetical protein